MGLRNGYPVGNGDPVTGTVAAVGATVQCEVSNYGSVMLMVSGTFAGVNCSFEGSLDGTTWFAIQAARSNANTAETTTGALSAAPAYAWEISTNAMKFVRVRATARTSGTQTWTFLPAWTPTENIPAIQTHSVTAAASSFGATTTPATGTAYSLVTTASTNAASARNAAASLFEITVSNPTATAAYVKVYNKASAPTVGTDVPVLTIPAPAGSLQSPNLGPIGKRFSSGIAVAVTAAAAATDTANSVAGVQVHATYI